MTTLASNEVRVPHRLRRTLAARPVLVTSTALLAVTIAATVFLVHQRPAAAELKPVRAEASMTVNVVTPAETKFDRTIAATGTIRPRDELLVGSDAAGVRLVEVLVDVGSRVQRGQLLARGDDALLRAQLAQADASIRQAQVELALARDNLARAERLQAQGFYSTEAVETRRSSADTAAAKVDVAFAQRQELEVQISHTRIVAPAAGVIATKSATVGAVIQPGTELFRLIRDGEVEWLAELPSHSLAKIGADAPARIKHDDGRVIDTRVRLVAPTIDASTRNGMVHVLLPTDMPFKAGAHARGEILVGNGTALAVPENAVFMRDGYAFVYVVGHDQVARLTRIQTGERQRGLVEVTGGLQPELKVVTTGAGFVKDGDLVRIAPDSSQHLAQAGEQQ
jgi:RND family efflux transporter MFP subunit